MSAYSEHVRHLRILLPSLAVLLLLSIFAWPFIEKLSGLGFESVNKNADQLTIVKPHYVSKDNKENPFEITADRAIQKTATPDLVHLENPAAHLKLQSHTLDMKAESGLYNKKGDTLVLKGAVELLRDDGVKIYGRDTDIDLKTNSAVSTLPLHGNAPGGTVEGQSFYWDGTMETLTIHGPAKLVLFPKKDPS